MSRSYRKTPIFGNTTAKSEKFEKRKLNRRIRRLPLDAHIKPKRLESNWGWGKDGRNYYSERDAEILGFHSEDEYKRLLSK